MRGIAPRRSIATASPRPELPKSCLPYVMSNHSNPGPTTHRPHIPDEGGAIGIRPPGLPSVLIFATLLAVPLAVGSGCGGGGAEGREAVSGTVTLNGAPLSDANIEFVPMSADASSFAGASIVEGEYEISASKGLVPGEYKVMVSMAGSAPEPPLDEIPGDPAAYPPAPELIPARFNTDSTLTATVEANGENEFDFELTK